MKDTLHLALARRGWLHGADVPIDVSHCDWVNVLRLMSGQRTVSERDLAARKIAVDVMTARGQSADLIAHMTGMAERSVLRLRARPVCGRPDPLLPKVLGWTPVRGSRAVTAAPGAAA